jgi:catechol 2,3-dioxygenase-like lactoylglutathione lyase family enzyme
VGGAALEHRRGRVERLVERALRERERQVVRAGRHAAEQALDQDAGPSHVPYARSSRSSSTGTCSPTSLRGVQRFRSPQVILFSEDVPRAAAFYARLGFEETFRVPADGEPIHVDLVLDGTKLGIASVASTRDDHGLDPVPSGQRAAVILWTDDVEAAYADVTALGAKPLAAPHEWLGRLSIAWVEDPDGNPIQLVQPRVPGDGAAPEPAV